MASFKCLANWLTPINRCDSISLWQFSFTDKRTDNHSEQTYELFAGLLVHSFIEQFFQSNERSYFNLSVHSSQPEGLKMNVFTELLSEFYTTFEQLHQIFATSTRTMDAKFLITISIPSIIG